MATSKNTPKKSVKKSSNPIPPPIPEFKSQNNILHTKLGKDQVFVITVTNTISDGEAESAFMYPSQNVFLCKTNEGLHKNVFKIIRDLMRVHEDLTKEGITSMPLVIALEDKQVTDALEAFNEFYEDDFSLQIMIAGFAD